MRANNCLVWDGLAFRVRNVGVLELPDGAQVTTGECPSTNTSLAARNTYARLMQINPTVVAYLGAGIEMYGFKSASDEYMYPIMLEYQPDFAAMCAPAFQEHTALGMCFHDDGFRQKIFISLRQSDVKRTLLHELFHSVYNNIPSEYIRVVESYGDLMRDRNVRVAIDDPDSQPTAWFSASEEAEAVAFERFALGRPMPFGLQMPTPVKRVYAAILAGELANHRVIRRPRPKRGRE